MNNAYINTSVFCFITSFQREFISMYLLIENGNHRHHYFFLKGFVFKCSFLIHITYTSNIQYSTQHKAQVHKQSLTWFHQFLHRVEINSSSKGFSIDVVQLNMFHVLCITTQLSLLFVLIRCSGLAICCNQNFFFLKYNQFTSIII